MVKLIFIVYNINVQDLALKFIKLVENIHNSLLKRIEIQKLDD